MAKSISVVVAVLASGILMIHGGSISSGKILRRDFENFKVACDFSF